eukprot:TRINITY_DN6557_c0_g2_i4.p1 TRINITY_DN6557_c0_g2~~TRINITY_DN6557_c0_g2_i4.p1  ORF type:complete len:128 (+),score=33.66 TRINITY_DN6557_c0_g2_i4:72-455(+)
MCIRDREYTLNQKKMNAPIEEDFDLLGKSKLEYAQDTKIPNAGTFTIYKEDHTLGNLVRVQLLQDRNTKFAGYRMPHPLENKVEIKVQTDGTRNPHAVLLDSLNNLTKTLDSFETCLLYTSPSPRDS